MGGIPLFLAFISDPLSFDRFFRLIDALSKWPIHQVPLGH